MNPLFDEIMNILNQEDKDPENLAKHLIVLFEEKLKESLPDVNYFSNEERSLKALRDKTIDLYMKKHYEGRIAQLKSLKEKMFVCTALDNSNNVQVQMNNKSVYN